jgi:GntR family transcriptional regulator
MAHYSVSQRLHDNLGQMIASTEPGTRLPSEPELAHRLGVSRATLREAMRTFETQGMIRRKQGAGTYVTHPSYIIESGLEVLESIETLADRIGYRFH